MDKKQSNPKTIQGIVVSISGANTIKVETEIRKPHSLYEKIVAFNRSYLVHVEDETKMNIGDEVEIVEVAPISKRKTWKVHKVIQKAAV